MTKIVHRRSVTGQFTTERFAEKHSKTTERDASRPTPAEVSAEPEAQVIR